MLINSDWHIHSEYSYDASNPLELIIENARSQGLREIGITDHLNYNDIKFKDDIRASAKNVSEIKKKYPFVRLGVELTPIELPEFQHIEKNGTREGYAPPVTGTPYGMELGMTKDELVALGVQYGIGASHWRVDSPNSKSDNSDLEVCIREWYRQQLFLACDERVTILGHPWYHGNELWYEDFSVIPHSMNTDIGAALKENGKYVECNIGFFGSKRATEKFKYQYAEFLRELFETGVPVTYGSDSHHNYGDVRGLCKKYLLAAGFAEGDLSELKPESLWQ